MIGTEIRFQRSLRLNAFLDHIRLPLISANVLNPITDFYGDSLTVCVFLLRSQFYFHNIAHMARLLDLQPAI